MLATSSGKSNQEQVCLTYGGFTEMNTGVAGCVGWDAPLVGGQTWELATGSEGGMVIRQTGTDGGVGKCLAATLKSDPKSCAVAGAETPLETCDCGNEADCGYHAHCPTAQEFIIHDQNASGGGTVGRLMKLQSALNSSVCLTTAPLAHAAINITLQIWAKPLASGATAAVGFNRGQFASDITFDWSTLGLPVDKSYEVRDLWAKASNGTYKGKFGARIQPHDVVMIVLTPKGDSE